MTNTEKVAYIRGLAEGLELDDSKKEVKVLNAIIDLLDDLAMSLADLRMAIAIWQTSSTRLTKTWARWKMIFMETMRMTRTMRTPVIMR